MAQDPRANEPEEPADEPEKPDDGGDGDDDEEVSSPFDHPFFLPVLIYGFMIWFGYDGFFNPDYQPGGPKDEHLDFSRYGFGVLVILAIYFTVQAIREKRREESDSPEP